MIKYTFLILICFILPSSTNSLDLKQDNEDLYDPFSEAYNIKAGCVTKKTSIWIKEDGDEILSITHFNEEGLTTKLEIFWPEKRETHFEYNSLNDQILKTSYRNGEYLGKVSTSYLYEENQKVHEYYNSENELKRTERLEITKPLLTIDTIIVHENKHIIKRANENKLIDSTIYSFTDGGKLVQSEKIRFAFGKRIKKISTYSYLQNEYILDEKYYINKDTVMDKNIILTYNKNRLNILKQTISPTGEIVKAARTAYEYCQN